MKKVQGKAFSMNKINLAELERRTGLSRSKLRRLKKNNFKNISDPRKGKKTESTVLSKFTGDLDALLKQGVTNSSVLYDRIKEVGYMGSLTTIKNYIRANRNLVPAPRQLVAPQGNRGRRDITLVQEKHFKWIEDLQRFIVLTEKNVALPVLPQKLP